MENITFYTKEIAFFFYQKSTVLSHFLHILAEKSCTGKYHVTQMNFTNVFLKNETVHKYCFLSKKHTSLPFLRAKQARIHNQPVS
jgi:hypothetical protein